MNILTVAAFTLTLLYAVGALVYLLRASRGLRRPWFIRFCTVALSFIVALDLLALLFFHHEPLTYRGLWNSLFQTVWMPTLVVTLIRAAKSPQPIPDRYDFML